MNKDSQIYVAGHRGLVGSAIHRTLKSEGFSKIITRTHNELDLTRQSEVEAFFESEKPECVFLAAAKVVGIWANNTYPAYFIHENIMIQSNVIHTAFKADVKKMLFLGSSCIYARECPQPMKEEYLLSGKLEPTNEPYAIAKIAGIKMCQSYNRQYGTHFVSVLPTNLYGPGDNFDLETSHALPALIRKVHEAKVRSKERLEVGGKRLEGTGGRLEAEKSLASNLKQSDPQTLSNNHVSLWGTGKPRREFLHVDDLAEACVFIMNHYDGNEIINIGVGKDTSIKELVVMIKDIVGFDGGIKFDVSKPDGTPQKLLDISKMESLGWEAKISLREGIEKTYNWYLENYEV